MKWFIRKEYGPILSTVQAETSEEALDAARRRHPFVAQRFIQVFNRQAPVPDPHAADEGRAWWMAQGL